MGALLKSKGGAGAVSLSEEALDADELREFLSADLLPDQADPKFKEALRRKLWDLVQRQYGRKNPAEDL